MVIVALRTIKSVQIISIKPLLNGIGDHVGRLLIKADHDQEIEQEITRCKVDIHLAGLVTDLHPGTPTSQGKVDLAG